MKLAHHSKLLHCATLSLSHLHSILTLVIQLNYIHRLLGRSVRNPSSIKSESQSPSDIELNRVARG